MPAKTAGALPSLASAETRVPRRIRSSSSLLDLFLGSQTGVLDQAWRLVEACWHYDPYARPNATELTSSLKALIEQLEPVQSKKRERKSGQKGA